MAKTLEERLAKLEELNAKVAAGEELQKSQQAELVRYHATLRQVLATSEQKLQAARDELAIIKTTAGATTEEIKRKQELFDYHQESYRFRLDKEDEVQAALDKTAVLRREYADQYAAQLNKTKSLEEISARTREQSIANFSDLQQKAGQAFTGTMTGLGAGATEALRMGPELATLMFANMYLNMGKGVEQFKQEFKKLPGDMETAATGMVGVTGKAGQEMRDSLTFALDPSGMQRMGVEGEKLGPMFRRVGLTAKEVADAQVALLQSSARYRMAMNQSDTATTSYITNQAAAFKKLGVDHSNYAQSFDILTNVVGMSNIEAARGMTSLQSVADSTGMTLTAVITNFMRDAPKLSDWGSRTSDVFSKLQANSAATGVDLANLTTAMGTLDTMDAATKAAATFNATFARSGVVMSATELFRGSPEEKLEHFMGRVKELNLDLSDPNTRFQVRALAESVEGLSAADIRRQILNMDDVRTQSEALNQIPKGIDETTAVIERGMTAAELQVKSFSDLGLSASKLAETIRPGATAYSEIIEQMFTKPLELTKESTTAYLGMAGAIETLNFGAGTIGGFMGSLPKFIAAAAAVPYIGPVVVTGVGAALGAAGAQVGTGVSFGTPTLATTDAPTTTARDDAARAQAQSTENLAEALKGGGKGINITLPVTLDSREIARQTMKIPASTVMRNE